MHKKFNCTGRGMQSYSHTEKRKQTTNFISSVFNSSQKARRIREVTRKGTAGKHESTAVQSLADSCLENKTLQLENVHRNTTHKRRD